MEQKHEKKYSKVLPEDKFLMVFLDNFASACKIFKADILMELLREMNYSNKVRVNQDLIQDIANKLECHPRSVQNYLSTLVEKRVFYRLSKGTYEVNPFYFGKGSLKESIKKLRNSKEWIDIRTLINSKSGEVEYSTSFSEEVNDND